ncbi:MAG TPA: VOC family protein [Bryobacteraceae bacterium]|nr:VOC family protein [Bryobacteraceae bacterium]
MPQIDSHPPGAFCWLELMTSDQTAAKQFYGRLFGWEANDSPMGPDQTYTIFQLGGGAAGAAYTLMADQKEQGVPPNWMLYVATESADSSAARATELGGAILGGPFDVADYGRMAIIRDPQGAVIALWQAKSNPGLTITGVPGTLCWADLSTPDQAGAKAFYSAMFGWEITPGQNDSSGYLHIKNGDAFIGGIPPSHQSNPNSPPHWLAYIAVTDCDATANLAKDMGAQLYLPPMSIENVGRMSIIADPQGAVFAIFTASPRAM